MTLPLNRKKIEKLLFLIEESLQSLSRFQPKTFEEFSADKDNFRIAFFDLHQTLEAVMKMAGYRNRMVHVYAKITVRELYEIIQRDLQDFERFNHHIKNLLLNPGKFNLSLD
ncbi:MAG: DUF86 domain-containing protein [Nitrospirae bacterium]|nr:DUF86 domain-containing protein [Nitrospirota bacterium]